MIKYKRYYGRGRFGNQLYYLLQAFKDSNEHISTKYVLYKDGIDYINTFNILNLQNYFCYIIDNTNIEYEENVDYHQDFEKDFDIKILEKFIRSTILNSDIFREYSRDKNDDSKLIINIRNGDYLHPASIRLFSWFDRYKFLTQALELVKGQFQSIVVVSDDNDLNVKLYDKLFHQYYNNITYRKHVSLMDDFMFLSTSKHKIIFNSTFSMWSSFISNCLYENSYNCIYSPSRSISLEPVYGNRVNKNWNLIEV